MHSKALKTQPRLEETYFMQTETNQKQIIRINVGVMIINIKSKKEETLGHKRKKEP